MYETPPNDTLFIADKVTPLSEAEIYYYLNRAFKEITNESLSINSIAILWAQVCLETAHGQKVHNWNYGNIKKLNEQFYTSYECSEIIQGKNQKFKPYHPQTFFAAWPSALEGAKGYLTFLKTRKRYQKAWEQMLQGNAVEYVKALKEGGYFTADLGAYTSVVTKLVNNFHAKYSQFLQFIPPELIVKDPIPEEKPEKETDPTLPASEEQKDEVSQPCEPVKKKSFKWTDLFKFIEKFFKSGYTTTIGK